MVEPVGPSDDVFWTGRTTRAVVFGLMGVALACFGVAFLVGAPTAEGGLGARAGVAGVGCLALGAGVGIAVSQALVYLRSVVSLLDDGLTFRDWRGRELFARWKQIRAVEIEQRDAFSGASVGRLAACVVWLVFQDELGEDRRVKLTVDESLVRTARLVRQIADRAGLVRGDQSTPTSEVWQRPASDSAGDGSGSRPWME